MIKKLALVAVMVIVTAGALTLTNGHGHSRLPAHMICTDASGAHARGAVDIVAGRSVVAHCRRP